MSRNEEDIEVDADPEYQQGRQPSHSRFTRVGGSMDEALRWLSPDERADIQQTLREADQTMRNAGLPPLNLGSGKNKVRKAALPTVPGGVQVQSFSGCSNIQIGDNTIINHHHYAGDRDDRQTQSAVDTAVKRIQTLGRPLTQEEKNLLAEHVGGLWRRLGRAIGFSDGQLDGFNHDFRGEGLYEVCYQMVHKWIQKEGPRATVGAISTALVSIRQPEIVRKVFIKR